MLDKPLQQILQKPLKPFSKFFLNFLTPNQMTFLGLIIGIFMCFFIFFEQYFVALFFLLANRIADALDGSMARINGITPLGGYLDIVFDFIIYAGFVLSFGISKEHFTTVSLVLLFSYIGTASTFLSEAAIMAKTKYNTDNKILPKSIYYGSGMVEGFETILYMTFCLIFPNQFILISSIFAVMCFITFFSRIYIAYNRYNS